MDPQATSIDKTAKQRDIQKAELERRKFNLWTVFNPTNQPFQVVLNAAISPEVHTIEAKSEAIVPYYVAEKYFEEMSTRIISSQADKFVLEENEKLQGKVGRKMDLHTEQPRYEGRVLKNLMSKRDQIVKILDRGLHKEFGVGAVSSPVKMTREDKESFDPGLQLEEGATTVKASTQPVVPASDEQTAIEEPDEEEAKDDEFDE